MQARLDMVEDIAEISREAGAAILEVYDRADFDVESKQDDSPLTEADMAAHRIILDRVAARWPTIPILSEESEQISWEERRQWREYFLVDPLDGTKEFIGRNGEFTVNIALIEDNVPVLGVVFVPVKNVLYTGVQGEGGGAWVERRGQRDPITVRHVGTTLTVVASRRHGGEALSGIMRVLEQRFETVETRSMGSSLKLCLVAEGQADLYPRLAPTSEWDTAAAHAIVEAAGGMVVDTAFEALRYNTGESVLNPHFYVIGDRDCPWAEMLQAAQ